MVKTSHSRESRESQQKSRQFRANGEPRIASHKVRSSRKLVTGAENRQRPSVTQSAKKRLAPTDKFHCAAADASPSGDRPTYHSSSDEGKGCAGEASGSRRFFRNVCDAVGSCVLELGGPWLVPQSMIFVEAGSTLNAVRYAESRYPPGRLLILSDNLALVLALW